MVWKKSLKNNNKFTCNIFELPRTCQAACSWSMISLPLVYYDLYSFQLPEFTMPYKIDYQSSAVLISGGILEFDRQDLELNVEYLIITKGGKLIIGSEFQPFEHKAVINLHGDSDAEQLPLYGSKEKIYSLTDFVVNQDSGHFII